MVVTIASFQLTDSVAASLCVRAQLNYPRPPPRVRKVRVSLLQRSRLPEEEEVDGDDEEALPRFKFVPAPPLSSRAERPAAPRLSTSSRADGGGTRATSGRVGRRPGTADATSAGMRAMRRGGPSRGAPKRKHFKTKKRVRKKKRAAGRSRRDEQQPGAAARRSIHDNPQHSLLLRSIARDEVMATLAKETSFDIKKLHEIRFKFMTKASGHQYLNQEEFQFFMQQVCLFAANVSIAVA